MKKIKEDEFLNKTISIRDRLAKRIETLADGEPTPEDIKQIKELTTVIRELDKMVRENRVEPNDQEAACSNFLESIIDQSIIDN